MIKFLIYKYQLLVVVIIKKIRFYNKAYKRKIYRFFFKNEKFSKINEIDLKNENVKGIIFDLGYSYYQIKDLKRGFSFNSY